MSVLATYRRQQYHSEGLACSVWSFSFFCFAFERYFCRATVRVLGTLDIMHPCTVHTAELRWLWATRLECPESDLLCFSCRTLFKQSPGTGNAAPQKKHLFVLGSVEKDIVPPELATKQDVVLQGSICSSPQRLKDTNLFWENSENASHNISVSLHKLLEIFGGFSPSFLLLPWSWTLCTFFHGLEGLMEEPQELVCAPVILAVSYQCTLSKRYRLSRGPRPCVTAVL